MKKKYVTHVALILVIATSGLSSLGLAACGSNDDVGSSNELPDATPETAPSESASTNDPPGDAARDDAEPPVDAEELFPDVLAVEATPDGGGAWTFSVTLSSPYDSPERYADAWRVIGPDGAVYGERILAHDHAGEQPFTRSQSGIAIPGGVTEVVVEGRDQISGWGGATVTYTIPR